LSTTTHGRSLPARAHCTLPHARSLRVTPSSFFSFNDPAPTEIYTLSLHDALPISRARTSCCRCGSPGGARRAPTARSPPSGSRRDRKSTRLNSSHRTISYAVFCLKKKKKKKKQQSKRKTNRKKTKLTIII